MDIFPPYGLTIIQNFNFKFDKKKRGQGKEKACCYPIGRCLKLIVNMTGRIFGSGSVCLRPECLKIDVNIFK